MIKNKFKNSMIVNIKNRKIQLYYYFSLIIANININFNYCKYKNNTFKKIFCLN